jgi:hypothetical protein
MRHSLVPPKPTSCAADPRVLQRKAVSLPQISNVAVLSDLTDMQTKE